MINPSVSNSPGQSGARLPIEAASWSDAARLCRKICILHEQGDLEAAENLRTGELARTITAIRTMTTDAGVDVDERIAGIFEAEQERVANAAVLAELLAPMLERRLAVADGSRAQSRSESPAPVSAAPGARPTPSGQRSPATDIAGFIDEMIAQERSAEPPRRRAS